MTVEPIQVEARRPISITIVDATDCHYCERAHELLTELRSRLPIEIKRIHMESPEGRNLIAGHRVPFPPLLLVDGRYFGHGRISKKKLERELIVRAGA